MTTQQLVKRMVSDGQLQQILYKYRRFDSREHTLDIFRKCEIHFSSPCDFNDPFDCCIYLTVSNDATFLDSLPLPPSDKKSIMDSSKRKMHIEEIVRNAIENVMNRIGICSFSRRHDDILMWSHYADNHKGICLEFDVTEDVDFFTYPINIEYQASYPHYDISTHSDIRNIVEPLLKTKYSEWEYEAEVRVYKNAKLTYSFAPQSLRAIYFGCKAEEKDIQEVKTVVKSNPSLQHVKFFKATKDEKEFKLGFQLID